MKKGLAVLWIIVITVIAMGGAGAGGWYYLNNQNNKAKEDLNKQIVDLQNQVNDLKEATEEAESSQTDIATAPEDNITPALDPYLYQNTTYGFSLQFNSKWQGYQMKEVTPGAVDNSAKYYYVCLPTTSSNYQSESLEYLAGTASIFALGVYSRAQWQIISSEEGPTPTLVGTSGNWVIGYSTAQDLPPDSNIVAAVGDIKNVVATFKAL